MVEKHMLSSVWLVHMCNYKTSLWWAEWKEMCSDLNGDGLECCAQGNHVCCKEIMFTNPIYENSPGVTDTSFPSMCKPYDICVIKNVEHKYHKAYILCAWAKYTGKVLW